MSARAIMLCGTASHVGKSLLAAALCRVLRDDGRRVVPFKAQNMSNNAAVCDGGEIGRAQALQARAAGVMPTVRMNPILLKPTGESRSQVVVLGRAVGEMGVAEYHRFKESDGRRVVGESFTALAETADVVVIEGAGSPVEINLKAHDIANLWMAERADARVLLVGDIDRGGVMAALVGTMALMTDAERDRVAGFLINKFRGERALFDPATEFLRERCGKPVLGVIPWLEHLLPEEDGLGAVAGAGAWDGAAINIGVVRFPRIANFSDFDPFAIEPGVRLDYLDRPESLARMDLIILPGSKATLDDLAWLRERGLDRVIRRHAEKGGHVVGICGGYQMLGARIRDPHGVEGGGEAAGLDLLPVETVFEPDKRCVHARYTPHPHAMLGNAPVSGYEIHMGRSRASGGAPLFADAPEGTGIMAGSVWGCYLHGLFENDVARAALLTPLRAAKGLPVPVPAAFGALQERSLDALAGALRDAVGMEALRALV